GGRGGPGHPGAEQEAERREDGDGVGLALAAQGGEQLGAAFRRRFVRRQEQAQITGHVLAVFKGLTQARVALHLALENARLFLCEQMQRVERGLFFLMAGHDSLPPFTMSRRRSRPRRMFVLMVPSGAPKISES